MRRQNYKILILLDYRQQFWLKTDHKEANFDIGLLKSEFEKRGCITDIINFRQIDFKNNDYSNTFVIYQSTEDPDHFYKSYIEDCLLGLQLKGATLIPGFHYFRAHDNKVFMEILRDVNDYKYVKDLKSEYFGSYEDYMQSDVIQFNKPKVFKLSAGAQSKNVFLLKSKKDFQKIPTKKSRTFNFYYWLVDQIKPFLKKTYPNYRKKSHHRRKFIIQNFVPGLNGDFKVLVYGVDYYVLSRKVKENDFKASGSGLFSYTKELPDGLLKYAKNCFESFDVPFIGLDIAVKDGKFYLIEFQFVHFGNYTLEKSPFHFKLNKNEKWDLVEKKVVLEEEFAKTINQFILNKIENTLHT